MRRGTELEVQIEKFADRGKSLAHVNGMVIFVPAAVPGDTARIRIRKKKKKYAEAFLLEVLDPSPMRTEPRCEYFWDCGGCKWQHVEYEHQLEGKRQNVAEALEHVGGLTGLEVPLPLPSPDVYFYRNKMEFSFSANRWLTDWEIASGKPLDKDFALGLHAPGRFDRVLDLKACYLQSETSARIVNAVRDLAKSNGWTPWNTRTHEGYLRHLVIRTSAHEPEMMINLVTNGEDTEKQAAVAALLQRDFPEVTTFINTIHTGVAQTAFGERDITVFGSGVIHDRIGPHRFEIAPNAFFQTNTKGAELLYDVARDFADLQPDDLLYDLYCGAGTISLFVADRVKQVVGVELVEEAVLNARANAEANGVTNCTFVAGDMLKLFTSEFVREHGRPDVLIVDPPRAGMHPKVVTHLTELKPERLIYISCNPQSQARDLLYLKEQYAVEAVQPVDLFPHTHHIENVVKLRALK